MNSMPGRSASDLDALARDLAEVTQVERDAPSAPLTTYRVGGPIALLVTVDGLDALLEVSARLATYRGPVLVVGRGSNLLVVDGGFPGVAVRLGESFERVVVDATRTRTVAGGATPLPVLARQSAALGCRGLEFFVGIPGTVGGAVRMNAGGHGSDTADVLVTATVLRLGDDASRVLDRGDLDFGFRRSALTDADLVVSAEFQTLAGDPDAARAEIDDVVRWRRANQPGGQNCGSVFVNPAGDSAGRIIEACGLKGLRIGGAAVSDKHANFVQADPDATAADIVAVIRAVQVAVVEATGVRLRTELRIAPEGPPDPSDEMAP